MFARASEIHANMHPGGNEVGQRGVKNDERGGAAQLDALRDGLRCRRPAEQAPSPGIPLSSWVPTGFNATAWPATAATTDTVMTISPDVEGGAGIHPAPVEDDYTPERTQAVAQMGKSCPSTATRLRLHSPGGIRLRSHAPRVTQRRCAGARRSSRSRPR